MGANTKTKFGVESVCFEIGLPAGRNGEWQEKRHCDHLCVQCNDSSEEVGPSSGQGYGQYLRYIMGKVRPFRTEFHWESSFSEKNE